MSESSCDVTFFSARVITVSDRSSRGERPDASGPALVAFLGEKGFAVDAYAEVVPDERQQIARALHKAISDDIALVVTQVERVSRHEILLLKLHLKYASVWCQVFQKECVRHHYLLHLRHVFQEKWQALPSVL